MLSAARARGAGLVVRANRARQRKVWVGSDRAAELWDSMAALEPIARKSIDIEADGSPRVRTGRTDVRLDVRATMVDIVAPKSQPHDTPPLRMLAVRITEPDPADDDHALDWLLRANEEACTAQHALQVVSWYEKRWLIEEYFKALKVGIQINDRRLDHADDLRKCLAFDAVTACTVMTMGRLARSEPQTPARQGFHTDEIYVLAAHMSMPNHRKHHGPPDHGQTMDDFVVKTARLAGFIPSKRQPLPGSIKLWEGYLYLRRDEGRRIFSPERWQRSIAGRTNRFADKAPYSRAGSISDKDVAA